MKNIMTPIMTKIMVLSHVLEPVRKVSNPLNIVHKNPGVKTLH